MSTIQLNHAITFAVLLPALLVAHNVADHWVQTSWQTANKGLPGRRGQVACFDHTATYTIVTVVGVGIVWGAFGLPISVAGFVTGQLVSAGTHYWVDRRTTLAWLCDFLGRSEFYRLGAPRKLSAVKLVMDEGREVDMGGATVRLYESAKPGPVSWDNPCLGTGAYALDQAWHWFWLFVAAVLTAVIP